MLPGLPARQPSPTESTHEPKAPKPSTLDPELALNPQPLKPKPKLTERMGLKSSSSSSLDVTPVRTRRVLASSRRSRNLLLHFLGLGFGSKDHGNLQENDSLVSLWSLDAGESKSRSMNCCSRSYAPQKSRLGLQVGCYLHRLDWSKT